MKPPEDDPSVMMAHWLESFIEEHVPGLPTKARNQLRAKAKELMESAETAYEDDPESDECPNCGEEMEPPKPDILQIVPCPPGYRAVYAESDVQDPTKMSVEDVVCFQLMRFPDGDTIITGLTTFEDDLIPCALLDTFMGYVPPGKNPDMYATKVKKFFEEKKKSTE